MCDICITSSPRVCSIEDLTAVFFNLGLLQAENRKTRLCASCNSINNSIKKVMSDNARVFSLAEEHLKFEHFTFCRRVLVRVVLDVQSFGRIFVFFSCLTQAARSWSGAGVARSEIKSQIETTAKMLREVLPDLDVRDFLERVGTLQTESKSVWQRLCDFCFDFYK